MIAIWQGLRKEFADAYSEESPRILHAFKAALAVILSMLICMRLELRAPGTAMVSAVIVMFHQQSGMVIARAFYRTLGMVAGCLAGLVLISLFAQASVLFLAGLSLWIGLFVAGSSYYKNYQSYGFVLSGYAACISTLPEWPIPYDVVDNIIYRFSEVLIGVAVGSAVSAIVFPNRVVPALIKWRVNALASLLTALHGAALGDPARKPVESSLKLIQESVAMEGLRTAAVFEEPEMRLRYDGLTELDRTFLGAVTRIFAIDRARQITSTVGGSLRKTLEDLFASLAAVTAAADTNSADSADAAETSNGLERLIGRLRELEATALAHLDSEANGNGQEAESGSQTTAMVASEVFATALSLRMFCDACKTLLDPPKVVFTQTIAQAVAFMRSVPIHTSGPAAAIAGLRAATAVGAVGMAWVISGWDNGYSAVVGAAITSGVFSLSPTPALASRQAFVGCLLACIVSFIINFILMPTFGDVSVLALCLGIALFVGSYVNSIPRVAVYGAGFNIYLCYVLAPTNVAVYDPPFLLDHGFALLIGIAVSALAFSFVASAENAWMAKRSAARIRSIVLHAAQNSVDPDDETQIGIAMRDLIVHISTLPELAPDRLDKTTAWAFDQLWIVNSLIRVRSLSVSRAKAFPETWGEAQGEWLRAMEELARRADSQSIEAALAATRRGLRVLDVPQGHATLDQRNAILEMRARLYSMSTALTDQLPALPAVPTVQTGGAIAS
jgi:uncharacterized membrane protein YccC